MWQFWGTLAISAFGGTFIIHYLKNFILKEKLPFAWDWDGVLERALITFIMVSAYQWFAFIPVIVLAKVIYRFLMIGIFGNIARVNEPGAAYQKVALKAELAFDLILSPLFAILVGVVI